MYNCEENNADDTREKRKNGRANLTLFSATVIFLFLIAVFSFRNEEQFYSPLFTSWSWFWTAASSTGYYYYYPHVGIQQD